MARSASLEERPTNTFDAPSSTLMDIPTGFTSRGGVAAVAAAAVVVVVVVIEVVVIAIGMASIAALSK